MTIREMKFVCAEKECRAYISGPIDAPAAAISHGICPACLKAKHPGAYYMGRRRAIDERLAIGSESTMNGMNALVFKVETSL